MSESEKVSPIKKGEISVSSQKPGGNRKALEDAKRPTAGDEPREVRAQNLAPLLRGEGGGVPPFIEKLQMSRREFLGKAGLGGVAMVGAACSLGLVRSVIPVVTPDPAQKFKIGLPQDLPEGGRISFDQENVMVFRDKAGIFAISLICSHLGCIVFYDSEKGFECPCHGSKFATDGTVTKGPAPSPLEWLELSLLPSGQMAVDKTRPVPTGTRLTV